LGTHEQFVSSDRFSLMSFLEPDEWEFTVSILSDGALLLSNSSTFSVRLPRYAENVVCVGTHSTLESVREAIVQEQSGAYLRFGDGDITAAYHGVDEMQTPNKNLSREIQAALGMQGEHVFKALMISSPMFDCLEKQMTPGNHQVSNKEALAMVEMAYPFWRPLPIRFVYSNCALAHAASAYESIALDFLETLRATKPFMFIGNEHVDSDLLEILFGPQCLHVTVPSSNAYSSIDSIEREARALLSRSDPSSFKTIVLAMGVSTSALQYRLRDIENLFQFDFGSLLDALEKWRTRGKTHNISPPAWIKISGFDATAFLNVFCERIGSINATCERYINNLADP